VSTQRQAAAFELRDLSKVYGQGDSEVRALDGVSLRIEPGDFVAIMGASGSGKSTCMNVIGCLDVPTSGQYLFHGVDVTQLDQDQRARLRRAYLGFIFQGFNLLARTSALDNVELPLVYRGARASERRERAMGALELVGLADRAHHSPAELSGGQQQRVAIARALVCNPALLLADEPTGNLDSARTTDILELLVELNRVRGLTIVMVTHEPEVASYVKRVITFRDGRVVGDHPQPEAA